MLGFQRTVTQRSLHIAELNILRRLYAKMHTGLSFLLLCDKNLL